MQGKKLLRQTDEVTTLSNRSEDLQGKVRSIGTRDGVNAVLYSIKGIEKNDAILDKMKCWTYTINPASVG